MFDAHPDPARIVPSKPLGPWALRPIRDRMAQADHSRPVILDLSSAPISSPGHVASILWLDGAAQELGVALQIFTPDMASAELLDFAGVNAPVFAGIETPEADPAHRTRPGSAY